MSKIVKYCSSCEEGFAAKFGFCPNCGNELQAFEMNPVNTAVNPPEPVNNQPFVPIIPTEAAQNARSIETFETKPIEKIETAPVIETPAILETPKPPIDEIAPVPVIRAAEIVPDKMPEPESVEQVKYEQPVEAVEAPKTYAAAAATNVPKTNDNYQTFVNGGDATIPVAPRYQDDGGFYVTVIEEKNVKQRNALLLGSLLLMIVFLLGSTVYSLFAKDLLVGAIDQGDLIASVPDVTPAPIDDIPPPKKEKTDGGGGGGGGKQQDEDPSKGRLPPQVKDPVTPPDPNIVQMTNPTLKLKQETQGNNPRPITDENTGVPNGLAMNGSSGRGFGGGIGNGTGTGVGNGRGTGEGNGIGSGSGNGNGNGNGNGTGSGGAGTPPPPPQPPPVGPSKGVNITSKPRANYTDAARQAQVQGTVTLRVTFLASGQIGSITPVSGLPNGLTEQAIAAARGIRFEPAMKNGVAQSVTKQVQYSFTIY